MRLWSLHPKYLDSKGLVALWRETLLAQNVLLGLTKGYRNHPQLLRFKETSAPEKMIGSYLVHVYEEAERRGYKFDKSKIIHPRPAKKPILVTSGQVAYEFAHLKKKLKVRDAERYKKVTPIGKADLHPLFKRVRGGVAPWEIVG